MFNKDILPYCIILSTLVTLVSIFVSSDHLDNYYEDRRSMPEQKAVMESTAKLQRQLMVNRALVQNLRHGDLIVLRERIWMVKNHHYYITSGELSNYILSSAMGETIDLWLNSDEHLAPENFVGVIRHNTHIREWRIAMEQWVNEGLPAVPSGK